MRLTARHHYHAPIELVFARMVEPELQPQYLRNVSNISEVQGRPDEVGSSFEFTDRIAGRDHRARTDVLGVEAPRMQSTETTYLNGMRVAWMFRLTATADGGTDAEDIVDYTLPFGLLYQIADWLLLRRLIARRLAAGGKRFKDLIEAEAASRWRA